MAGRIPQSVRDGCVMAGIMLAVVLATVVFIFVLLTVLFVTSGENFRPDQ